MTTRLSCWTDWILRLAAVAGIMAFAVTRPCAIPSSTHLTIQHLLRRRLAEEFEHFAAVSRQWNRLAKWQLGADFRQRNPGIRPIWGARRHQTRRIRWNSIDERLPGSGKLREPLGQIGQAGVISQGNSVSLQGGTGTGGAVPQFANTGTTDYRYYLVARHSTFGPSNPLYAGKALSNGTGNITVTAPDIAGANSFDLLRVTPVPNFREQAPFGGRKSSPLRYR